MGQSTYLADQQSLPLRSIEQETRLVFPALNDPHTFLSLCNIVSNNKGLDALLSAGFVGVNQDVATST